MASPVRRKSFEGEPYKEQGEVYCNDGREVRLLNFVLNHPNVDQFRGNPQKILDAIDEYGRTQNYLMNVGAHKSKIVIDLIKQWKPKVMVELGGYVGYSAIAFASALREVGGTVYYSLEKNPRFAHIITNIVELAGLSDLVKVVVGSSSASLKKLHEDGLKRIDMLFLDHHKKLYIDDLKTCEDLGLIQEGTVLAADNVVKPGNPRYLAYVRASVEKKRQDFANAGISEREGNPNLQYESQLIESWEPRAIPDGIEVTQCVKDHTDRT